MPPSPDPTPTVFRTQRVLRHTPAAVYAAFADADRLARWWGPRGFTNSFETFEFRDGGRWEFVMRGPDGGHYQNASVFRRLVAAESVVIEHLSPPHFTLTVTLAPHAEGTHLSRAQAFPDPAVGARVRAVVEPANEESLDRLSAELERGAAGGRGEGAA
jgi:uncharacterized protein YndB with AHSA1/START domain